MSEDLTFYHTFANTDIWQKIDTVSGKITYTFWCNGISYERNTFEEAIEKIRCVMLTKEKQK